MARPTALQIPWPRGPVVTSMPGVSWDSGCPGVMLSTLLGGLLAGVFAPGRRGETYAERLEIVDREGVAVEVEESILEHASMAVAVEGRSEMSKRDCLMRGN